MTEFLVGLFVVSLICALANADDLNLFEAVLSLVMVVVTVVIVVTTFIFCAMAIGSCIIRTIL